MAHTLRHILKAMPQLSAKEQQRLTAAYEFARQAHGSQKRESGEDYFTHPAIVAQMLAELGTDEPMITAALLHDTVEDTKVTLEKIAKHFGPEISHMVNGLTQLRSDFKKGSPEKLAQDLRKMFESMSSDLRIIIIKIVDRLHNMRTLGHTSREKQLRKAQETMDIFVPMAKILGLWEIQKELEDISFAYLEPKKYAEIRTALEDYQKKSRQNLRKLVKLATGNLKKAGISVDVSIDFKGIYEVERFLQKQNLHVTEYKEPFILTLKVSNELSCYRVLDIVHRFWKPIHYNLKDYISSPQGNYYQALHNRMIGPEGKMIKVRILTEQMHVAAQKGILAEIYPENRKKYHHHLPEWLQNILRISREQNDDLKFLEQLQDSVLRKKIFVIAKDSTVVNLPRFSSGIDYAFLRLKKPLAKKLQFKINGHLCSIKCVLADEDIAEIIPGNKGESPHCLWLLYAKTHVAKHEISRYLQKISRSKAVKMGREALEREFQLDGKEPVLDMLEHKLSACAAALSCKSSAVLLENIGRGKMHPHEVYKQLFTPGYLQAKELLWMQLNASADRFGFLAEILHVFARHNCHALSAEGYTPEFRASTETLSRVAFLPAPDKDIYGLCTDLEQLRDVVRVSVTKAKKELR